MDDWLAPKGTQVSGEKREELARRLRMGYEAGATIRTLSQDSGRSYGAVRRLLLESGARLRRPGTDGTHTRRHDRDQQPPPLNWRTRL